MLAAYRGRRDASFSIALPWLLGSALIWGGLLELVRGFHPPHIASGANLLVATGAAVFGGMVYHLQLASVRHLLTPRRRTGRVEAETPRLTPLAPVRMVGDR